MISTKKEVRTCESPDFCNEPFYSLKCEEKPHGEQMEKDACESLFSDVCSLQRMPLTFSHGHPLFLYI